MMYPMHNNKEISGLRSAGSGDRAKSFSEAAFGIVSEVSEVVSGTAKSKALRWGSVLGMTAAGLMGVAGWAEPVDALATFNAPPMEWTAGTNIFAGSTNATTTMNTSTGTSGFDSQFTGDFVRVGSRLNQAIGAINNTAVNAFAQTSFAFGDTADMPNLGSSPDLQFVSLSFDYVFDGQEATPNTHNWQVSLIRYLSDGTLDGSFTPVSMTANITGLTPSKTSFETNEVFVSALSGGQRYGFRVTLNEVGPLSATNNTALGFDNIVVRAAVPYELETGLGLGAVGLFIAYRRLKKRAALKGTLSSPDAVV